MMQSSNACVTDDDESVTISDQYDASTETDMDVVSKDDAVEPQLKLESTAFRQGEKVLAYHNSLIYEAKVLEVDSRRKHFYVHYLGWNQKWDEWVDMDRLMKHNKENLEKQKALEKEKISNDKRQEEENHLVKLPCSPNVDDILRLYLEHQSNKASDSAAEIVSGLHCYFDKALPAMLLYKGERQQFEEATAKQISPSKIYGAEHLLRLFVKLPEILYHANIEEDTLTELQHNLQDFLKFLQKKQSLFFLSTYKTPDGSCTIE
ncbi:hypothetical protein L1887_20389 [Cichorium endivia]|nr:hypothetical protein L1887_20389 [Cichorium endivia]